MAAQVVIQTPLWALISVINSDSICMRDGRPITCGCRVRTKMPPRLWIARNYSIQSCLTCVDVAFWANQSSEP
jgi:hypothetical protein